MARAMPSSLTPPSPSPKALGAGGKALHWVDLGFVNVYLVGEPGGRWAIVDAGMDFHFDTIRKAAAERFGKESRPEAIYLTHGHQDHCGAALALATYYDVPIYVHRMELPYVTGRALYPPLDPTVGGAFGFICRFYDNQQYRDLGEWVQPLPVSGELPGMSGWQVLELPGHSPGQVGFYRARDRAILAGDACTTVDLDWLPSLLARTPEIDKPPQAATPDWVSARKSLRRLAALQPRLLCCGHGVPIADRTLATDLYAFAEHFSIPLKGRYVSDPARFDENGVVFLPPPGEDPLPKVAAVVGVAAAVGYGVYAMNRRRKEQK